MATIFPKGNGHAKERLSQIRKERPREDLRGKKQKLWSQAELSAPTILHRKSTFSHLQIARLGYDACVMFVDLQ